MVKVNGKELDIAGMTITDYLKTTAYELKYIAVEKNTMIVHKAKYDETIIEDGDVIEVVSFVGGG